MKSPGAFRFEFRTQCERKDRPFVARVTWDTETKSLARGFYAIQITPVGRFGAIGACAFDAAVGDIVEVKRGEAKDREYRGFYLVVPKGYLILVAIADEVDDALKVVQYVAGQASSQDLAKGHWRFETATSSWKGRPVPTDQPRMEPTPPRLMAKLPVIEKRQDKLAGESSTRAPRTNTTRSVTRVRRTTPP
ncbi:MAG: hypothetical protein H8K06_13380 [Nitrospira sp.]|jgi:hypothetical protein|nr:hypothetical protein [Nitrospira sp.]